MQNDFDKQELINAAAKAMFHAYAPYSGFQVGAAVLAAGSIYTGCNIENVSYPAGICAERVAAAEAIKQGHSAIDAIAVASSGAPPFPCGVCLQFLSEFAGPDVPVYIVSDESVQEFSFGQLFPKPFHSFV